MIKAYMISHSMITGAGGGIGLSIVQRLLEHQAVSLVVAVDVAVAELEALRRSNPSRLVVVAGDVSQRLVNYTAIEIAIQSKGKLDCIILNAAVLCPVGPVAEISIEDWKRLIDVNFVGLVHAVRLLTFHACLADRACRSSWACRTFVRAEVRS